MAISNKLLGMFLIHKDVWYLKQLIAANGLLCNSAKLAYYRKLDKSGSWIGHSAKFANIPCFPHGIYSIFISGNANIGRNCTIFQQVTIGSNTLHDSLSSGSPSIGDNCYIGSGAKIIGNVKVGNNCRIGANAVVAKNIPDNSVVVLGSPRVICKEHMDNRYLSIDLSGDWVYWNHDERKFKKL